MSHLKTIILTNILALYTINALSSSTFSPYADITINTHWNTEFQDMEPMDLNLIATQHYLKAFHLAFITDSGHCQAAWASQTDYSIANQWGKRLTDELAKLGVETTISFGGASGNDLSMNCSQNQLVDIFNQTIKTYQAKKIDLDVENGTADVPKLIAALKQFQEHQPKIKLSFTLPVLPEGLTPSGQNIVTQAAEAKLQFNVNIMAMDYGPAYNGDMGGYAQQASTALHHYLKSVYPTLSDQVLWHKIEITPMIGVNDVNTEQFTLQNASALKKFAVEKNIGGLSMWSISRDKPCPDNWASPTCSGKNLQKTNYEFVDAFLGSNAP